MGEVLQNLSPPALAEAVEENFWEVWKLFPSCSQFESDFGQDVRWAITGISDSLMNVHGCTNLAPDAVDSQIEAAIGRASSWNIPVSWRIGPTTKTVGLGEDLERHGFTFGWEAPGMAADLLALNDSAPAPAGLVIERVGDADALAQFCHIAANCFGIPDSEEIAFRELWASVGVGSDLPLRHYLGWLEGKPVATSSVFVAAGVAGIYIIATLPEVRRTGIGAAMTLAACREGRTLGYRAAVLEASQMGYGVYQNLGFREVCRTAFYVWQDDAETEA